MEKSASIEANSPTISYEISHILYVMETEVHLPC